MHPNRTPEQAIATTPLGRDIVELFAFGCLEYMIQHQLLLTEEGFNRLVQISEETGLNGRIAFQVSTWTQQRMQLLFHRASGISVTPADDNSVMKLRRSTSIRNRLLSVLDGTEQDDELFASLIGWLGEDVRVVLEALKSGDCQRDLVWEKIKTILADEGDAAEKIEQFRLHCESDAAQFLQK